ncbi:FAD-dependent monooxygenase [Variovorax fucosicus]|uniref:FAD-dependent monooxygenase n=1 Tax=Variovorax fucosicus TaxID=3053517 RepID=UPI0025757670|nr:FAD-dependent monooxygenase [Variovorax sp. J22G47]MDM0058919.1 FAD-dependent monooxygenase [Variovorax sp. J22G47]
MEDMYFSWKEMPLVPPADVMQRRPAVLIIGAGPVGLATALGLSHHGVESLVLETRDTISKGSRALAMNRRSMQILDQLGVGEQVLRQGLHWADGWTFYQDHLVHTMRLPQPAHEKHGQTNLQQCWMEQLLLEALAQTGLAQVCYQHTVSGIMAHDDGVRVSVHTPAGDYQLDAGYIVAADGPRGMTRKWLGIDYEGTSYSQRFVINDIICKQSLPEGRRLFFSPPYLPGKTVLMHKAPYDMWRLDFQLMEDQDAETEMQPERVHQRIRAHFDLMKLQPDYELVLTSVYRANALSLPTYNQGRVLFAGDAAHQVPIFGGRGVNHGYEDAHNLAWKLAAVIKGAGTPALLDSYTQERRGALLDTLAELTRTTIFITTPSPGMSLVREAVLSLSIEENFVAKLFDPYASAPYDCVDSPLNATEAHSHSEDFGSRCRPGALAPDLAMPQGGSRLYDSLGPHFTVLQFGETNEDAQRQAADLTQSLSTPERVVKVLVVDSDGDAATLYDARTGTCYLIRPDQRIAGRWRAAPTPVLQAALLRATGMPDQAAYGPQTQSLEIA